MAIRSDISIDWSLSPRIITIDAPSTKITMQDLYDTLRTEEVVQVDEPRIIAGAGKEPLGDGLLVGLTLTLNNALLAFEARTGPSYIQCLVSGGNLVAVDNNGDPVANPIFPTSFTQVVMSASSSATLIVTGGSALTTEEHDKLMSVPDAEENALELLDNQNAP